MHGDVALDPQARLDIMPRSTLVGAANLLVLPNLDAANIAYNLLKTAAGGNIAIGPILLGAAKPVHILTASATVRRIVNMAALTVVDAQTTASNWFQGPRRCGTRDNPIWEPLNNSRCAPMRTTLVDLGNTDSVRSLILSRARLSGRLAARKTLLSCIVLVFRSHYGYIQFTRGKPESEDGCCNASFFDSNRPHVT